MQIQSTIAFGLLASTAAASQISCGTSPSSHALRSISESFGKGNLATREEREQIKVNTYVHVIAASEKEEDGYLTKETVQGQIDLLNESYEPHDISFELINATWIVNESWANPGGSPVEEPTEPELRAALRVGSYKDLNLFFIRDMAPGGKCELPIPNPTKEDIIADGCIMKSENPYEAPPVFGFVTVHEVGHWLGLEHTFENGCKEPGDYVDDTPYEAYPAVQDSDHCPSADRDTCPDQPGLDPTDNFMTYVNRTCGQQRFTPGQATRMHQLWEKLRA